MENASASTTTVEEQRPRRMGVIVPVVLVLIVAAVVIPISLSRSDDSSTPNVVGGVQDGEVDVGIPSEQPSAAPFSLPTVTPSMQRLAVPSPLPSSYESAPNASSPSSSSQSPSVVPVPKPSIPSAVPTRLPPSSQLHTSLPTGESLESIAMKQSREFVREAISVCPGVGDLQLLDDETSSHGQVYLQLVNEYFDSAVYDNEAGTISFMLDGEVVYFREKFALEMFYISSNGESWSVNNKWNTATDPCSGWYGVLNCPERIPGQCSVIYLNLNSNNLQGSIAEELCCLPCLEVLSAAGNRLGGSIPQCLKRENLFVSLELNDFTDSELSVLRAGP